MKRVVVTFKEGIEPNHMNIPGDGIERRDEFIYVWEGEFVVAMVRTDTVNMVCISEKRE